MSVSSLVRFAQAALLAAALGAGISLGCASASPSETFDESSNAFSSRAADAGGLHLRVVAGNLSTGNNQSWDPGEGMRILKGLGPDVALLQEMNFGADADADYQRFLGAAFDASFSIAVEHGVQIPNGIVSRYPIKESGHWTDPQVSNRSFQWARIDIPGDKDLWAVSLHLLTTGTSKRQAEATALVAHLKAVVPATDYIVIGGDFNSGARSEGTLQTLSQLTRTTAPWPADSNGDEDTNASRGKAYDWVIASPGLDAFSTPVKIGAASFANGLVFDSRTFPTLADVAPVLKSDSAAKNMQHMAVVRDFALPN